MRQRASLRVDSRHVRVANTGIAEVNAFTVRDAARFFDSLPGKLSPVQRKISETRDFFAR